MRDALRTGMGPMLTTIAAEESITAPSTPASDDIRFGDHFGLANIPNIQIIPLRTVEIDRLRIQTGLHAGHKDIQHTFLCMVELRSDNSEEQAVQNAAIYIWAMERVLEEAFPELATARFYDFRVESSSFSPAEEVESRGAKNNNRVHRAAAIFCTANERVGIGTTARP
jgi:hypothetical protein